MRRAGETRRRRLAEALEIEREDALRAGELAFFARALVNVGMPQGNPDGVVQGGNLWRRKNGNVELTMVPHPDRGLPYGRISRLLMCFITTEAVRKREPRIDLGPTLSGFLSALGLGTFTGGARGSGTRLRDQLQRLCTTTTHLTVDVEEGGVRRWKNIPLLVGDLSLCWHVRQPDQPGLWPSSIDLKPDFYAIITERPVPVDRRALQALSSVMALDLYLWLTYRLSYLDTRREILWMHLEQQFGACYSSTWEFRRNLLARLPEVLQVYPSARISVGAHGLVLAPSAPHVPFNGPSRRALTPR